MEQLRELKIPLPVKTFSAAPDGLWMPDKIIYDAMREIGLQGVNFVAITRHVLGTRYKNGYLPKDTNEVIDYRLFHCEDATAAYIGQIVAATNWKFFLDITNGLEPRFAGYLSDAQGIMLQSPLQGVFGCAPKRSFLQYHFLRKGAEENIESMLGVDIHTIKLVSSPETALCKPKYIN